MISPSRSSAIEIAKCGIPCRKLVVPSSGSTIQRWRGSVPSTSPPSSNRRPWPGRARCSSFRSVRSAFRSAVETNSPGPLIETCNCSTSPKSRTRPRAAFKAALVMTLMIGERVATPFSYADLGAASILRPLDIAAVGCVDDDPGAGLDVRRDHDPPAVFEPAGLIRGGGGLAAHDGIRLDDGQFDGARYPNRERRALIHDDLAHHAVAKEIRGVAE